MNILLIATNSNKETKTKQFSIGLFDLLGFTIQIGTNKGVHLAISISAYKLSVDVAIHQWDFNITKERLK